MLEFRSTSLSYGPVVAVHDVNLTVATGSFVALLGPSGCGKTTLLRSVAGLAGNSTGEILINGRSVTDLPVHKRNVGLVFQNYALFPHKTVFDNIAFGLKYRGLPKAEIKRKVTEALEMVQLPTTAGRYPSQLSGGQQQRIAIARAIVTNPDVLLLDEPLSALDANLRADMRSEIRALQQATGITTVFVTHDQEEALAMADVVVVMKDGCVIQTGTPEEIYRTPKSRFVAEFIGHANILKAEVVESGEGTTLINVGGIQTRIPGNIAARPGDGVEAVIRSAHIHVFPPRQTAAESASHVGRVVERTFLGDKTTYTLDLEGMHVAASAADDRHPLHVGDLAELTFDPARITLLDATGHYLPIEGRN
ncbi:ABC transporter ATP-binding protein (plasmid) [Agrobacterium tumefaciens]|uniref:Spermidine/putrescine import ATP-binding protein PotA n=1 Tax=Agrobacterium tumefaciens TaxID=358 RepID=A0AAJ4N8Q0_AGRTU|nr:ABC transporter ATP-binding protein [Agrobacterium tumefaciens]